MSISVRAIPIPTDATMFQIVATRRQGGMLGLSKPKAYTFATQIPKSELASKELAGNITSSLAKVGFFGAPSESKISEILSNFSFAEGYLSTGEVLEHRGWIKDGKISSKSLPPSEFPSPKFKTTDEVRQETSQDAFEKSILERVKLYATQQKIDGTISSIQISNDGAQVDVSLSVNTSRGGKADLTLPVLISKLPELKTDEKQG